MPGYAHPEVLVSTAWVAEHLDDPRVRIVESDEDRGLYTMGHVPGAVEIDWQVDLQDPLQRDYIDRAAFERLCAARGIANDTTVVLYGDKNNWFAAWGVWIFKTCGAKDVRILNGGRDKWVKEGRALTPIVPAPAKGTFVATAADPTLRAFLPDVLKVARKQDTATKLVDIRSADEFSGKIFAPAGFQELAIRAGHVPGAKNVPWGTAVNADGTFKSIEELRRIYAAQGIDGRTPVITYCRIGERAAHTWFVLSQILGYEVKLYDGSWTEYGNSVGVPIENPAGTVWGKG